MKSNYRFKFFLISVITLLLGQTVFGMNSFELVTVPDGTLQRFWLSVAKKNKKLPNQNVINVSAFESMVYAVTVSQFAEFLKKNPEWSKEQVSSLFADESYLSNLKSLTLSDKAPMTSVSWFAAKAFCESNQMRLPTVSEWEYMAAASENKKNAYRDEKFLRRILDWYGEPRSGDLKPVGHIYKNIYGVWDLHGLIWEWVEDFNSNFVTGESREDTSFDKNLFCGSGSMGAANKNDYAAFMRFSFRSSLKGVSSIWNLGFRCVRSI